MIPMQRWSQVSFNFAAVELVAPKVWQLDRDLGSELCDYEVLDSETFALCLLSMTQTIDEEKAWTQDI